MFLYIFYKIQFSCAFYCENIQLESLKLFPVGKKKDHFLNSMQNKHFCRRVCLHASAAMRFDGGERCCQNK